MERLWLMIGLLAQGLFFSRFLVQWVSSEKAGRSVVPITFWYFSIGGSLLLLFYAIHQEDPVFILGQSVGFIVYTRNLYLIQWKKA